MMQNYNLFTKSVVIVKFYICFFLNHSVQTSELDLGPELVKKVGIYQTRISNTWIQLVKYIYLYGDQGWEFAHSLIAQIK